MARQVIINLIKIAVLACKKNDNWPEFKIPEISVETPEDKTHGDYSSNIALKIAKVVKKNPTELAQLIVSNFPAAISGFEKIEAKEPGFINFFLSKDYLQKKAGEILKQGEEFGKLSVGRGLRVNIEFISANPTGPLHIGNGRNAFNGDVLANVLEKAGFLVTREYFINDAKNSSQIKTLGQTALGKGEVYLTEYLRSKIKTIQPKLKKTAKDSQAGFLLAKEVQKETKKFIEKKLKIKIDRWVSEEEFYKKNKIKKTLDWLAGQGIVYEKDNARWLKTSQFGDDKDWVIVRETGEPTYLLSDIAYHKDKVERGFRNIIEIFGADHQAHASKIKAAMRILGYEGQLDILILQLVTLKGKERLSKRRGRIVLLEDLVDEIGLDVARFIYLQKSLDTHMEIDLELAKEQSEKNPVYYVQYAHARICAILRKVSSFRPRVSGFNALSHQSELSLIKQLIKFPEVVEDTARDYQLQRLPKYALDMATAFHQFYRDCRVISEDKELTRGRLGLISATKIALKNTLNLMGISAPEKM